MKQYAIRGGNPLVGEIEIGGAKNAALPILAAAIMTDETVYIDNLPDVSDVNSLIEAVAGLGVYTNRTSRHSVSFMSANIHTQRADHEAMKKIRASYYLIGALLGKYKHAEVPIPGGCDIGIRAIDQHIKGFKALGADIKIENGYIKAHAEKLVGSHIYMDISSVGATINVMMAAAMASDQTIIENAAKEPHVVDCANFLNMLGAKIKGAGTDVIRITGVPSLHGGEYTIIPDQIEAGTFMFAAAATRGDVVVKNVIPKHLESTTAKLLELGCEVNELDDCVRVVANKELTRCHVKTLPYPGFPTDMQPQMTVVLGLAKGTSIVTESIFDNRFRYVDELTKMGANIKVEGGDTAIVEGVSAYTGANLSAPDLRAGAALVIAALAADGVSLIDDIHYIERGYEDFPLKLKSLGASIEVVESERDYSKFLLKTS